MIYKDGKEYYSEQDVRDIVKGTVESLAKVIEEKDAKKPQMTKKEILAIPNTAKRQQAIIENIDLFK